MESQIWLPVSSYYWVISEITKNNWVYHASCRAKGRSLPKTGTTGLDRLHCIVLQTWIAQLLTNMNILSFKLWHNLIFDRYSCNILIEGIRLLSDPGEARGCSTNTSVINWLTDWWFVEISLRRRHALVVKDGAFSHKIDYSLIF